MLDSTLGLCSARGHQAPVDNQDASTQRPLEGRLTDSHCANGEQCVENVGQSEAFQSLGEIWLGQKVRMSADGACCVAQIPA